MKILVFTLIIITSFEARAQSTILNLRTEIDKIIRFDTDLDINNHHGFILGIIDHDSTYILNFEGNQSLPRLDASLRFQIGGLSKVITAGVLTVLESMEYLDLNDRINNDLPNNYKNINADLTWMDLMTHHSGLPKQPAGIGIKQVAPNDPYRDLYPS